jgi:hypothetical protein
VEVGAAEIRRRKVRDLALTPDDKRLYFGEHAALGKMGMIDLESREVEVCD